MSLRGHLLRFAAFLATQPTLIFANLNAKQQQQQRDYAIRTPAGGKLLGVARGQGSLVSAHSAVESGRTQLSFKLAKLNENSGNIQIDAKLIQLMLLARSPTRCVSVSLCHPLQRLIKLQLLHPPPHPYTYP